MPLPFSESTPSSYLYDTHRQLAKGWIKAVCIAIFAVLALIAVQSARMGVAGLTVELAQSEVNRWAATPARRGLGELNRVAGYFSESLGIIADNPWALEGLGARDLARVRVSRTPAEAVAFTRDSHLQFRRALQQRPTSPFLWANIARSKLLLDEIDEDFFKAMRYADELGPWEPASQQMVLFAGLAAWAKLDPGLQQSMSGILRRGSLRNAPKLYEIVKSYMRFDLVCGIGEYNSIAGPDCRRIENAAKSGRRMNKGNR